MITRQKQMSRLLAKQMNAKRLEKINKTISNHLNFSNNRYSLNLTSEKCEKIGLSLLEYKRVLLDLKKLNNYIAEAEKNSNPEIMFSNSKRSSLAQIPSGTLTSIGQEMVSTGFWAPLGAKAVRFTCRSGAIPMPGFTCKTKALATLRIEAEYGALGTNKIIDVPIVASECTVEIFFQTTDPNGGSARWELIF